VTFLLLREIQSLFSTDGCFPEDSLLERRLERGRESEIDFDPLLEKNMVLLRVLIPEWIYETIIERIIVLIRRKGEI
jgi:hypothetical protein